MMPNPKKLLETLYGVPMQDGGKLPPGIKRATERAKESKSVLPVAGARQARQAIQGYLGMDPSFSVMDPEAQALESAYRGGETASVLGDLVASLTPFAAASAAAKTNQLPGIAELIAYHGSPHKFKKFDASKIGTGEGAQAYGHGLYFAENPEVAKSYRITTTGKLHELSGVPSNKKWQKDMLDDVSTFMSRENISDPTLAIEGYAKQIDKLAEALPDQAKNLRAKKDWLLSHKDTAKAQRAGSLYTVDIPDEKIAQMLDLDKPLSQQPWQMKRISPLLQDSGISADLIPKLTGKDIMAVDGPMASWFGVNRTPKMFAEGLRQEGIPGVKYLDQVSRNKPLKDIKREFLNELPEDASIDEVVELLGTGTFSPKNEAIIKELAANDWLGFDYPAQSLSTVLSPSIRNYEVSPSLMRAINEAQEGGTRNFVLFPGEEQNIKMLDINGEPQMAKGGKVQISDNPDTMLLELTRAPRMQEGGKLPPGVRRAISQQRGTVAPIPGIKTPAEFIGGYVGADPRYSVMDPDADALERAYRGGEATSVIGDLIGSISPFAAGSVLARANALPGMAAVKPTGKKAVGLATPRQRESVTLSGALAPLQAPVRGETSKELLKAQSKQLTDQEKETLDGLRQTYPDFSNAVKFMTPQEVSKIIRNPEGVKEMDRLLQTIPSAKELAAVAKAGTPKQGWYRASTQALIDVFGIQDAPRFASLLAAMSPQTSVESNLINALNTWKNWTAAGRPTDPQQIKAIMGQSVQGSGTEASVLDAWTNNAMRALRARNPLDVVLSGPKVDSFYRNLADDVYRVTNDAWMASGLGVDQGMFSGSPTALQLSRGDPGLSPGYIASSARMREAGQLNKMLPSEAQETSWSYFMPLYEMQRKTGLPAREILQRGLLTPESIRGTPDFSTLLTQGQYGDVLRQAGYGEQLSAMKPYQFPQSAPSLSLSEQREVERAARRLESLKGLRESESRSKIFELPKTITLPSGKTKEIAPESGFASAQIEYIPGEGTGILPDMITASPGTKQYFSSRMSSAFRDPQERDILQRSVDLEPLQTRSMTGSFRPSGEIGFQGNVREQAYGVPKARETNPGYASLVEVPLTKRGDIPKEYKDKLAAVEALRGYMTGQQGSTYNLQVPTLKGESAMVKLEKKADPENIRYASAMTDDDVFLADTGRGVAAIFNPYKPGNLPLGERGRRDIADYLGSQDAVPTRNISDYIDYSEALTGPQGTGAATRILQERLSPLDVASQKRLSEAAQPIAGDVLELMTKQHERANIPMRPDYARALELIKRGGIPALMAALAAGEALPAEMVSELLSEAR